MCSLDSDVPHFEREALIENHTAFVHKVVKSTIKIMRLPQAYYNEYVSAGYLGLVEAAERYDPLTGVSFRGFAYLRVRGAIIDSIRQENNISGQLYQRIKILNALEDDEAFVVTSSDVTNNDRLTDVFAFAAKALNCCVLKDISTEDADEEESIDPEQLSLKRERDKVLKSLIQELPEKERYILESYYFEDKTFSEISHIRPELSRSWISRLHSRALERLQIMMATHYYEKEE